MKKRTLLILALGVSFTPAVFAADLASLPVKKTGEQALTSIQEEDGAIGCNLRAKDPKNNQKNSDSAPSNSGIRPAVAAE